MATRHFVCAPTRFKSIESAEKSAKKESIKCNHLMHDGVVFRSVWCGEMRGSVKEFISQHVIFTKIENWGFNGYGYKHHYNYHIMSSADSKAFISLVDGKKKEKKEMTWEQKRDAWARRLVKLLSCCDGYKWVTMEVATEIANEKADYQQEKINEMIERQSGRYSTRRETLIRKMERENPLRRIENVDHAKAIITASNRHNNSNYEVLLDEYKWKAKLGNINHEEIRALARQNCKHYRSTVLVNDTPLGSQDWMQNNEK